MKKLLIIFSLLLIGCYTIPPIDRTPVSSMSDSRLEAEYLNLSSEISILEMELYGGGYRPDHTLDMIGPSVLGLGVASSRNIDRKKQVEHLRLLKRRLNEVQLERSRRGSSGLGAYP